MGGSRLVVAWLCLSSAAAPPARADWAFTRWGMTPEQVVAASGGAARLIPPGRRERFDAQNWELAAEGSSDDGGVATTVGFMFDTQGGGLTCVLYNAAGDDAAKLEKAMVARYGRPAKDGDFGPARMKSWSTPDAVELVVNPDQPAAAVTHCAPGK